MAAWNTERAAKLANEMIGKKYGKLTVTRYLGVIKTGKNTKPNHMIECTCECGRTRVLKPWELRSGLRTACLKCAYSGRKRGVRGEHHSNNRETLCWSCAKATNRHKCRWAGGKPRTDWEAIPTHRIERIPRGGTYVYHDVDSFIVVSCPGFVKG